MSTRSYDMIRGALFSSGMLYCLCPLWFNDKISRIGTASLEKAASTETSAVRVSIKPHRGELIHGVSTRLSERCSARRGQR